MAAAISNGAAGERVTSPCDRASALRSYTGGLEKQCCTSSGVTGSIAIKRPIKPARSLTGGRVMTVRVPVGRHVALSVLAGTALLACASGALAQTYPLSPVRIIVGFGPGSTADILARLVARHMETSFGQPVLVENRPGNSSMSAAQTVSRAPKDGYTLFMATVANTLNPVQTSSPFNLGTDLEP